MMTSAIFHLRRTGLMLAMLLLMAGLTRAAEITARASLSRGVTVIGDAVQYQIKVSGAQRLGNPPEIEVDGLVIHYSGPSQSSIVRFQNGSFVAERSVTFIYQVVPEKNGTFTIPAMTVEADGRTLRTEPVALTVQPSTASGMADDPKTLGFAEFLVPKKTAYLGETIPMELKLYVDARIRWQPVAMPEIVGEGFTKQKMPEPQREQVQKNGRDYDVLTFKTAITPSRAGKITIGPSVIPYNARVPRARKGGPRSLFDMFDDDVFGDPFFSAMQQMKARAEQVEITVKPLPAAGRPANFSGAVGTFQFSAEGTPRQVKIGDPVTMKLKISGRGNFDRLTAPALKDPAGWRTYPPSNTFKAEDEVGYAGTKFFDMAVVPETEKTEMPVFQFSYFDPLSEKYATINSEPAALIVEGGSPPVPAAPPAPATASMAPEPPQPLAAPRVDDILGLRYDPDPARSFAPLYARREFWYAQGGIALVWLMVLGVRARRAPDAALQVVAELRREKALALARLRTADLGQSEFMEAATRVAQLEVALLTGRLPESVDASAVCAAPQLSEGDKAIIEDLFSARAESLYAGGASSGGRSVDVDRARVLAALEKLEKGHGRV
jgi:hypothetical protein